MKLEDILSDSFNFIFQGMVYQQSNTTKYDHKLHWNYIFHTDRQDHTTTMESLINNGKYLD